MTTFGRFIIKWENIIYLQQTESGRNDAYEIQ